MTIPIPICLLFFYPILALGIEGAPGDKYPVAGIHAGNIAIVVNDADPLSGKVADYYRKKRLIPETNVIHVSFTPGKPILGLAEFRRIKSVLEATVPSHIQAYALAWTLPYRVECMSITTAFAAGFDEAFCSRACGPTKQNLYYDSDSRAPFVDFKLRPTMLLAGINMEQAIKLIDRGVAADNTFPRARGYLVSTKDKARNVRAVFYPDMISQFSGSLLDLRLVKTNHLRNRKNVLFYFTGVVHVRGLETIQFLPGAIADHLTSAGGVLTGEFQMSSLRWLEAGATGSYGTVVEPCNYLEKFPNPRVVVSRYLSGETLIESYWKSVAWPGQGLFIGEPLAKPYGRMPVSSASSDYRAR